MNKYIVLLLTVLVSGGLGLSISALVFFLSQILSRNRAAKFQPQRPEQVLEQKGGGINTSDKSMLIFMGGGLVFFGLLSMGSSYMLFAAFVGAGIGMATHKALAYFKRSSQEFESIKEVALLYESIDLFLRAGFTVRESLQLSQVVVPRLRPHIHRCLDRWPSGPLRAIQQLGEDIGSKYADLMTGLLMQAEERGSEDVSGVMEQEAVRLEELRVSLAESKIAAKPIYSAVYLLMPVSAVLGILIAPLAYRAIAMISGVQSAGGLIQ
ncbi:MAG: hypothetical protein ACYC2T_08385 [Bacillota bacterium]